VDAAVLVDDFVEEFECWALGFYEGCFWVCSSVCVAYAHYGDVYCSADAACSGDAAAVGCYGFWSYVYLIVFLENRHVNGFGAVPAFFVEVV